MRAYLIDPWEKTVEAIDIAKGINAIYDACGYQCFQCITVSPGGDTLYVDDEGLFVEKQAFFSWLDYPQPLAGKALMLGTTKSGDSCSPLMGIETVKKCVTFHGELAMDDATRPQPFMMFIPLGGSDG